METGAAALEALREAPPEVVLLDLQLPDMNGMDILKYVSSQQIPTAVVIITAHASVNVAVEAMRYGAYDFVVKPFTADRLMVTVRNAVERLRLAQIVDTYTGELARSRFHGFIGSSLAMQGVYRIIKAPRPVAPPCSSPENPAPARKSARRRFIGKAPAATILSWRSTAAPSRKS